MPFSRTIESIFDVTKQKSSIFNSANYISNLEFALTDSSYREKIISQMGLHCQSGNCVNFNKLELSDFVIRCWSLLTVWYGILGHCQYEHNHSVCCLFLMQVGPAPPPFANTPISMSMLKRRLHFVVRAENTRIRLTYRPVYIFSV